MYLNFSLQAMLNDIHINIQNITFFNNLHLLFWDRETYT